MTFDRRGRQYIYWTDLECTGSTKDDYILEIGAVITDRELNEIDDRQIVLPITAQMEENLPDVVREMHTVNGLLDDCKSKVLALGEGMFIVPEKVSYDHAVAEADLELSAWIKSYNGADHMPFAGSGVGHYDRRYYDRQLPLTSKRLTYWPLDIGVVRRFMDLAGVQLTTSITGGTDAKTHRALDDTRVHINEARRWIEWARWN
jgi:oligoribonuclease (3'-5' exoribonuclease)